MIITTKLMRPREENDHYPTPLAHVRAGLDLLPAIQPARILDPGAGGGIWGTEARSRWPESNITGVELRTINPALQFPYDCWYTADFLDCPIPKPFDLVIGNPPYRHAEAFVRRSIELLDGEGTVLFLLRLAFLESQKRGSGLFRDYPPSEVVVCSDRPSFTVDGKTDATAYAYFIWNIYPLRARQTYLGWTNAKLAA